MQVAQALRGRRRGGAVGAHRGAVLRRARSSDLSEARAATLPARAAQGLRRRSLPGRGRRGRGRGRGAADRGGARRRRARRRCSPRRRRRGSTRWSRCTTARSSSARSPRARALVGVNNRDLRTLEVRLETALELAPLHPGRRAWRWPRAASAGRADVRRLREAGFDAFLVGEHLMRRPIRGGAGDADPRLVDAALGRPRRARGPDGRGQDLRDHHASRTASRRPRPGADALGFVFWPSSPRYVDRREPRARSPRALPPFVLRVGVFVDAPRDELARDAPTRSALDLAAAPRRRDRPRRWPGLPRRASKAVPVDDALHRRGRAALRGPGRRHPARHARDARRHRRRHRPHVRLGAGARAARARARSWCWPAGSTPENVGGGADGGAARRGRRLERRRVGAGPEGRGQGARVHPRGAGTSR